MTSERPLVLACIVATVLVATTGASEAQVITRRAPLRAESPEKRRLETVRTEMLKEKESESREAQPVTDERRTRVDVLNERIAELDEQIAGLTPPTQGADFLTQAGVNVGQGTDEVGVQAADLFFSRDVMFFLRSTLPISAKALQPSEDAAEDEGSAPATEPAEATLTDNIRSALMNPYGGLLYATVGYLPPVGPLVNSNRLDGVSLDLRAGLKAAEIPSNTARPAGQQLEYVVSPFFTANAGLRVQKPLFRESDLASQAGDFAFSMIWVWNAALDRGESDLFAGDAPVLHAHTHALHLSVGVMLSNVAYVSLEGTPVTKGGLGKRWVVGLNLIRAGER